MEPHGFEIPGSGFAHRGARIVPIVRMYQNGAEPTGRGSELGEPGPALEPHAAVASDPTATNKANAHFRTPLNTAATAVEVRAAMDLSFTPDRSCIAMGSLTPAQVRRQPGAVLTLAGHPWQARQRLTADQGPLARFGS